MEESYTSKKIYKLVHRAQKLMFSQHSKSQQIYTINLNLGIPTN